MKILRVDHIGIAVKSLDETIPFYRDNLGMEFKGIEEVAEQMVRVAFGGCRVIVIDTSPTR